MKGIKIEKDIPIPPKRRQVSAYPLHEMGVGESFLVPSEVPAGRARSAAHAYGLRAGKKFTTRQTDKGLRIWRTE